MSSYPKWIYHATKEAKVVLTEEEHKEHGKGWAESPALLKSKDTVEIEPVPEPVLEEDLESEESDRPKSKKAKS